MDISGVTLEEFIRESARNGLSKNQVREALGIPKSKFWDILRLIPDLKWSRPHETDGFIRANREKRGQCSENQKRAILKAQAAWLEKRSIEWNGHRGSVEYLSQFSPVGIVTIRKRLKAGWTEVEALSTPRGGVNPRLPLKAIPKSICDICGRVRGGIRPVDHRKCSEIRKKKYEEERRLV